MVKSLVMALFSTRLSQGQLTHPRWSRQQRFYYSHILLFAVGRGHILLPASVSGLALFPNANAVFAARECCSWMLTCLKDTGQAVSVLTEHHLPCR